MPHCMFSVENEVHGYPLISFPDVCTNEPLKNSVFCKEHFGLLQLNGIPTKKEEFLQHIGCKREHLLAIILQFYRFNLIEQLGKTFK